MSENATNKKSRSPLGVAVITAALTLLLAGGGAYYLGYLGPRETRETMEAVSTAEHPLAKHEDHESVSGKERKILYWRAPMNPTEIYDKPGKSAMGMDLVPVYEEDIVDEAAIKIDPVTQQNMGIRTAEVKKGPLVRIIRTYGHITPDETLTAQVSSKTNGWIEKLYVDFAGKYVKRGQPLYDIYSPELVAAQEEYLVAYRNLSGRLGKSGRDLLHSSRRRLEYFDVSASEIKAMEKSGRTNKTVMIRSPLSGYVIQKKAEEGAFVRAGSMVFRIADLSRIWVETHIYEYELSWVTQGQEAEMTLLYLPGEVFSGRVSYVYPYLQPKTRDLIIRLEFENPDMKLKPDMYADVRIKAKIEGEGLIIPSEAVIRSGERNLVFVTRGEGKFSPRDVTLGLSLDDGRVQILTGLTQGESVVTSGQFLLDSESKLKEAVQKMLEARRAKAVEEEKDFFEDLEEQ